MGIKHAEGARPIVCFFGRKRRPRWYNHQLHLTFFERAFAWHGYRLVHHGPVMRPADDGPVPFDKTNDSLHRLIRRVKPAALMVFEWADARWALAQAPPSLPKIVYAVDVHRIKGVGCYAGADAVIVRAKRFETSLRQMPGGQGVGPCRWLPFSVNVDAVNCAPPIVSERDDRVVFCGSRRFRDYPLRGVIIDRLRQQRLLSEHSSFSACEPFSDYAGRLKSALVGLATTGALRLNMAKHIEIPACGTCLMTNGGPGTNALIPPSLYVKFSDASDAVKKAKALVSTATGRERARNLGRKARAHVLAHHSDEVRAAEVMAFLSETVGLRSRLRRRR